MWILISVSLPSAAVSSRVVLTLWGAVTLLCGAFIFGQSTTITIMQMLGKIWRFPCGAAPVSCVWAQSQIHGSKHEITVKQVLFTVSPRGRKWCRRSKTRCWSFSVHWTFEKINSTFISFTILCSILSAAFETSDITEPEVNKWVFYDEIQSDFWWFILRGNCRHSRLLDCSSLRNSSTLTAATFFLFKAFWTISSKCLRTTTTSWWQLEKESFTLELWRNRNSLFLFPNFF